MMKVELVKTFRVEAAHSSASGLEDDGLHGHSYLIQVGVSGDCDDTTGWLIDYADISAAFEPVFKHIDHHHLNEVLEREELYESDLSEWISEQLKDRLPLLRFVSVSIAGARAFEPETLPADAVLELPERIGFGFEAAHALPSLPPTHKCSRMHGHSFRVEVAGEVADLAGRLEAIHNRLDHRCLNRVAGLENPTSEYLARWVWDELSRGTESLRAVSVAETCTARCVYRGK